MKLDLNARPDRWPGLELRHLTALLAVAEEASFNAAAERLGYTQPAISQQIAAVERIVGARLLDRPRQQRAVTLTPAGEAVARHARAVMDEISAAYADVQALSAQRSVVRIGTTPTLGPTVLPWMLVRLAASCPDAEVELSEAFRDVDLLSLLGTAEIDLCVAELPLPEGPFGCAVVAQEPFVLVVQAQSPLAERSSSPSLREIAALPLLCTRHSRGGERALQALREAAEVIRVVCCSDTTSMLHGLVAAGLGVALLPQSAADRRDARTAVIDLAELLPPFHVGVVWNTSVERSAAVEAAVAAAEEDPPDTGSVLPTIERRD